MCLLACVLVLSACTSEAAESADAATPTAVPATTTVSPEPSPEPSPTVPSTPTPAAPTPTVAPEVRAAARDVAPVPLGTFVVARPGAGVPLDLDVSRPGETFFEVPVYDEPFGEPRTLLMINDIDGTERLLPLVQSNLADAAPLVLRVIAGSQQHEWIKVQAPIRPHNRYVWVRASDFEFGFTSNRIEIDLVGPGRLRRGGTPGQSLHGTNQPELMGQQVSSGGIRVPNDIIDFIAEQPNVVGA